MATTYNRLLIDVNQKIDNIVTAKQSDTASRFLDVSLYSNGVPINLTGHSVKIYFKKPAPDNTEVFTEGEVTDATAGRCQFELTTQTLAVYGDLKAEISIWSGDTEVLTTQTFIITVFEMLRSDNTVESRNEFGVLVTLFQSIQNSLDMMNAIKTNFGEAGEKAAEYGAATFWRMLEALAEKTEEAIQLDVSGKIGEPTDTTGNTVFGKFKTALNSTIGTADAAPLNEVIEQSTYNLLYHTRSVRPTQPFEVKTILSTSQTQINGSTTSTVVGSFVYNGDDDYAIGEVEALLMASSDDYGDLYITSAYSTATTVANLNASKVAYLRVYGNYQRLGTTMIKAQKGVTYYVHIGSSDGYGYCYSCEVKFSKAFCGKQMVNSAISKTNTVPQLIGSFSFSEISSGVDIYANIVGNLKSSDYNYNAEIIITTGSTYNAAQIVASLSNQYFVGSSQFSTWYQYFSKRVKFDNHTTYYVYFKSGLSNSNYPAYCDDLWIEYSPIYAASSQILGVQKGYASVTASTTLSIPIDVVNPEKCSVDIFLATSNSLAFELSNETLSIKDTSGAINKMYWQITEHI